MSQTYFKALNIDNISFNFAITLPFNGKDTLCIYNDRKFALRAYGYLQSGLGDMDTDSFVVSKFLGLKSDDKINYVKSIDKYVDITNKDKRESYLYFLWDGDSNRNGIEKMQDMFIRNERFIYENFVEWMELQYRSECADHEKNGIKDLEHEEYNKISYLESEIEERISMLIYQNEIRNRYVKNKSKKVRFLITLTLTLYAILFSIMVIFRLF